MEYEEAKKIAETMIDVVTPDTGISRKGPSLVARFASRFGVDADKIMATLKSTAFKAQKGKDGKFREVTNEQMMALLVVADQYGLNPFTKEIYAFPDKGGIVPVVGVDGWIRIMNQHAEFDGIEFEETEDSCTAVIYRKDRAHPTVVTEYMSECKRSTDPWRSHPRRMLRHRATIQANRIAFGFAGIYDPDEAERIIERDITPMAGAEIVEPIRPSLDLDQLSAPKPAPLDMDPEAPDLEPPTFAQVADMINNASSEEESRAALEMGNPLPAVQAEELLNLHFDKWALKESK